MTTCIIIGSLLLVVCAAVAILDERRWRRIEREQRRFGYRGAAGRVRP
jgi:hypothetical protein